MYKGRKPVSFWKGNNMRHDDTRDNTTALESNLIAADAHTDTRENAPAKILPVIVTVDELPRLACDYPKPYNPQHVVDGVAVEDAPAKLHQGLGGIEGSDKTGRETWDERCQRMAEEAEDDGQPDEYTEWQDYMGGDEYYDHSENACW